MQQLQPYWQLNAENKNLILDSVQIFLWAKGVCLSGHQRDGKLVAAKAYAFDQVYDLPALQQIIMSEPLLADATLVKQVWMAVSRNILFPQHIIDSAEIDAWMKELYFVEHDEALATSHANDEGIDIVYPKKVMVRELLGQYFPNRTSKFLLAPKSLSSQLQHHGKAVVIIFLENLCSLTFFEQGKLMHNYIFEPQNPEDIVIEIGNFWDLDAAIRSVEILVTGIEKNLAEKTNILSAYFDQVNVGQTFDTTYFLETLSQCE